MTDRQRQKQGRAGKIHAGCCLALLVLGLTLAACGKKPGSVDPPPEVTDDVFPRVYPDITTDPKP